MAWTTPGTQTTGTLITAALWNQQVTDNMTFMGTSHDHSGNAGDGATLHPIPAGAILVFDAACPSGWTRVSAFDGKFVRGAAAYGATGGADTHTHSYASHTHPHTHAGYSFAAAPEAVTIDAAGGSSTGYAATIHTHTLIATGPTNAFDTTAAGTTDAGNSIPAYQDVIFCKKN